MHQTTGKVPACLTSLSEKLVEISFTPGSLRIFTRTCCENDSRQAKTIPGLRSYEVNSGDVMGIAGKHGVYLVAILEFDSMSSILAGMASPQGHATAADLANFAGAGLDVMMSETRMV